MLHKSDYVLCKWSIFRRNRFINKSLFSSSNYVQQNKQLVLRVRKNEKTIRFPLMNKPSAFYSTEISNDKFSIDSSLEDLEDDGSISRDSTISSTPPLNLRLKLYPTTRDDLVIFLSQANSIQEVFSLIEGKTLNEQQISQAVVSLWDIRKCLANYQNLIFSNGLYEPINLSTLNEFTEAIRKHPQFNILLQDAINLADEMSDEALASVLLSLQHFKILDEGNGMPLFLLTSKTLERISNFPLTALSRWCLAINFGANGRLVIAAALPPLQSHMQKCESLDDLKLISICLISVRNLIDSSFTKTYNSLVTNFLDKDLINKDTSMGVLTRILRCLIVTSSLSVQEVSEPLRRILHLVEHSSQFDTCPSMSIYWIKRAHDILNEPYKLSCMLEERACRWLEDVDIGLSQLSLLHCINQHTSIERKKRIEHCLKDIIEREESQPHFKYYLKHMYLLIRQLKITDTALIDSFWNSALRTAKTSYLCDSDSDFINILGKFTHMYLFFNRNLGGTYRLRAFEIQMLDWIYRTFNSWEGEIPNCRQFCRLAAFVLSYGTPQKAMELMSKLMGIEEQLNHQDVIVLSHGMQLPQHRPSRYAELRSLGYIRDAVDFMLMLDRRTLQFLSSGLVVEQSSLLLQAYQARQKPLHSSGRDYSALIQDAAFQMKWDGLNARIISYLSFFLPSIKYLPTAIVDQMLSFCLERHEQLSPDLLSRIPFMLYELGYCPSSSEFNQLLPLIADVMSQNCDRTSGLNVVECALGLLLHNYLTPSLVNNIFSVKFLDKLDREVAACYSKASYPNKVRKTLMELNRGVCIDMPEANVPWFHEKYCLSKIHSNPPRITSFHTDVQLCLNQLLKDKQYYKVQTYTPYFNLIDFEFLVNKNGDLVMPMDWPTTNDSVDFEKIAVLTWLPSTLTTNRHNLTGQNLLRQRHIEMQGYRVVGISYRHWNSLPLSTMEDKCKYLSRKLSINT